MEMTRDVVVVGAGPAGSVAAAVLARHGHDVLLMDRASFPRDKTCGDGVPPGTVEILNRLGMKESLRDAGFHSIRGIRLVSPRGREWRVRLEPRQRDADFFIAPRVVLDDLIRRHAIAGGAEFCTGAVRALVREGERVTGVRATVDGRDVTIPARIVIGADGATSVVARALLGDKPIAAHRAVAIRAYVHGIATLAHTIELHWYAHFAPGYAWVFPTGPSSANVGVVVRADRFKQRGVPLDRLLDDFLQAPEFRRRMDPGATVNPGATWQLPSAIPRATRRAFDGALLVGDAARLVDALTGEGIHNAVASADIAADVTHRALSRGDASRSVLAEFDARCERELEPLIRRSYRVHRRVAEHPLAIEATLMAMRAAYGPVTHWLNKSSTDFAVSAYRG
jgi:geranylgeranyl reductase family protein